MDEQREDEIRKERCQFVVKSNALIQKTRYELTLEEQRLLLYIISKIKPDDERIEMQHFTIRDYCEVCGIDIFSMPKMYGYMKDTIKKLADKSFWVKLDTGGEMLLRWIDKAKISKYSGTVDIKLNDDLIPYLLELQGLYTQYQLVSVLPMKSKYSARLYEILRSELHRDKSYIEVTYSLDTLQDCLGITEATGKSYRKNPSMFRQFVIDRAVEEIALYTDISASVEYIRTGRKLDRVKIKIKALNDAQAIANTRRAARELYNRLSDKEQ